jgi:ceramide glucosyltransferase
VTVIRPVKGLDPKRYDCLAATFYQDYPGDKLTVYLCVLTQSDPAYPILQKALADFPHADARIYIEAEDPSLRDGKGIARNTGPNPKIRNMSRAYREAKGDIVWILDCNIWVGKGVCGRMVDKLCGLTPAAPGRYKFVHHLPIVVDIPVSRMPNRGNQASLSSSALYDDDDDDTETSKDETRRDSYGSLYTAFGGRLEELFLSSAHAKMYTAINTLSSIPCVAGKSNMFRRSHLDHLTQLSPSKSCPRNSGIEYFSDSICEDASIAYHMCGNKMEEEENGEVWKSQAMVYGDLAIQPVVGMRVKEYLSRRVRWQRARKFTAFLATLVEPGTDSIFCSLMGVFGINSTIIPYLLERDVMWAAPLTSWVALGAIFLLSMAWWAIIDWNIRSTLLSMKTVEVDENAPLFIQGIADRTARSRCFPRWFAAWLGRECLALPIWIWAFYGGSTVSWRGRKFKVGFDGRAKEIVPGANSRNT